MATWGSKLYQNDVAQDVRDGYLDLIKKGVSSEDATSIILRDNPEILNDADDAPVFWIALADTQWKLGKLVTFVKEKAISMLFHEIEQIDNMKSKSNFQVKRLLELNQLKDKLLSEMPAEKTLSRQKNYTCEWEIGDVFAYKLTSDSAKVAGLYNKYVYFIKVSERLWYPEHIIPIVYIFDYTTEYIADFKDVIRKPFRPQVFSKKSYDYHPENPLIYHFALIATSKKSIPKNNLFYLGNIGSVKKISQFIPTDSSAKFWKEFEKYIIKNIKDWTTD